MIRDNILAIKERMCALCSRLQKDPGAITLVAVSKERSVEEIREAVGAGITDIGENRVQEALLKYKKLFPLPALRWHMVGHLQTNKVKQAVVIFYLIHSVDSVALAAEIDKEAARINRIQDILIQVNTSFEESKSGIRPDELIPMALEISRFKNVSLQGLMTIAPITDTPGKVRPYFKALRELRDKLNELRITSHGVRILSMGMSDDFEAAIEEGATLVRIGRGIFG